MRRLYLIAATAAGVNIIIVVIALLDLPYRMQDGKRISLVVQVVCLPHKQGLFGGAHTLECMTGFKSSDDRYFAFRNSQQLAKQEQGLVEALNKNTQFQISGQFSYGPDVQYQQYDIAGMMQVNAVLTVSPPSGQ